MELVLAALVLFQDDVARLIDELGADEPAARAKAEGEIVKIGLPAYEALQAALDHTDVEVRDRARRLLQSPPFLGEEIARGRFDALGGERWREAVEKMLQLGREKLAAALRAGAPKLEGDARFRAEQLRSIASGTPQDGLLYGIVLQSPVFRGITPCGLEVWINASDRVRVFEAIEGGHNLKCLARRDGRSAIGMGVG
jgi:hypothetical protein